jgi:hypothetical protein
MHLSDSNTAPNIKIRLAAMLILTLIEHLLLPKISGDIVQGFT